MNPIIEQKMLEYQAVGVDFLILLKNKKYSYSEMIVIVALLKNVLEFSIMNDKELKKTVIG